MTKRDFVAIAQAVRLAPSDCRCEIAANIARHAAASNPRFDFRRFLSASGCG